MEYKEKLEEAKELYKTANADQKYALELLFPEIKENEEERIRNEICTYIGAKQDISLDVHNRWLSWLEKQGEQQPAEWSEEDEKNLIEVISIIQNISSYDKQYDRYINWLKSIRQRYTWKPTKEQMYMLEWLTTNVLDDGIVGNKAKEVLNTLIEQLKSL